MRIYISGAISLQEDRFEKHRSQMSLFVNKGD